MSIEMYEAIGNLSFFPCDGQMLLHTNMQSLMSYNPMDMHGMHQLDLMHHDVSGNLMYMRENTSIPIITTTTSSSSSSSNINSSSTRDRKGDKTAIPVKSEKGEMSNNNTKNNNNNNYNNTSSASASAAKVSKTPVSQYNLRNHSMHTVDSTADYLNQSLDSLGSGELDSYRYSISNTYMHMLYCAI